MNKHPNNLSAHREKIGLTTMEMAIRLECSLTTVYSWESGNSFPKSPRVWLPIIEAAYEAHREELWPTKFPKK